jgi:hypothetical protein
MLYSIYVATPSPLAAIAGACDQSRPPPLTLLMAVNSRRGESGRLRRKNRP